MYKWIYGWYIVWYKYCLVFSEILMFVEYKVKICILYKKFYDKNVVMMGVFFIILDVLWFFWGDNNRIGYINDYYVIIVIVGEYLFCVRFV